MDQLDCKLFVVLNCSAAWSNGETGPVSVVVVVFFLKVVLTPNVNFVLDFSCPLEPHSLFPEFLAKFSQLCAAFFFITLDHFTDAAVFRMKAMALMDDTPREGHFELFEM